MARFAALLTLNVLGLGSLMLLMGVRINISPSYPLGLYRQVDTPWQRRDLVISCLPRRAAKLGLARGYLVSSQRCQGHTPVIKRVIAMAGDQVTVGAHVSVNGRTIPNTQTRSQDSQGRALTVARGGITPIDHVWLVSNLIAGSFDSRYFGAIPTTLIQGKLEPLWTL